MKVLIATDAWEPQVNGVVMTLKRIAAEVGKRGVEIAFVTPQQFRSLPMPGYGEIRLAFPPRREVRALVEDGRYDFVHVATEGPVGLSTRAACMHAGRRFTTSFHTRFPEYLAARLPVPPRLTYALLRRFHNAGKVTMAATPSLAQELRNRGFERVSLWSRGVDADHFRPRPGDVPRFASRGPVFLYVGRIAVEKNIEAFLALELPGTKVVVGDGPARAGLARRYPATLFLGTLTGDDLARAYAGADVFVFPSRTDTFGLVLIEALASGLPVAAFPVRGPLDVIGSSGTGVLDDDLRAACLAALDIERDVCRQHALTFTWENSARQFLENLQ